MSLVWPILIIFIIILAIFFRGFHYFFLLDAERRIPVNQIELINFKVIPPCAFSHILTGRVKNRSTQYTLKEMALQITGLDCVNGDCHIIGQREKVISINVPPGQAKDMVEYVDLSNMRPPLEKISWQYKILCAKGID